MYTRTDMPSVVPARPGTAADTVQDTSETPETGRGSSKANVLSDACVLSVYSRWKLLRRKFAKIDAQRKGRVSRGAFCRVMQKNAFAMSTQDFAYTQAKFSDSGGKGICYHNFLRHVLKLAIV